MTAYISTSLYSTLTTDTYSNYYTSRLVDNKHILILEVHHLLLDTIHYTHTVTMTTQTHHCFTRGTSIALQV